MTIEAVSYTHLEVYKRQDPDGGVSGGEDGGGGSVLRDGALRGNL